MVALDSVGYKELCLLVLFPHLIVIFDYWIDYSPVINICILLHAGHNDNGSISFLSTCWKKQKQRNLLHKGKIRSFKGIQRIREYGRKNVDATLECSVNVYVESIIQKNLFTCNKNILFTNLLLPAHWDIMAWQSKRMAWQSKRMVPLLTWPKAYSIAD